MRARLDDLLAEHARLEAALADPALLADQSAYTDTARRFNELSSVVVVIDELRSTEGDLEVARELVTVAEGTERPALVDEIAELEARCAALDEQLRAALLPTDPNAGRNVIIEIRGAEGGEEANLFARDLFDMYRAFASRRGWRLEVLDATESAMGGIGEVTFTLAGDDVWTLMKHEAGPHRVQRVPVTESQGRVHTSSATVTVLPEADEVDVAIDPADLSVEVFRASGPGGQSVNTTDSAVRVTHRPTGITVSMQDQKSQLQNKTKALTVLRARLLAAEQERMNAERSVARRSQTGGGGRSEKVRTYNFKENRLTDHRIGLTIYRLDKVLAGDLDEVVEELVRHERAELLAASEVAPDGGT
ncbi:MAG: peptide chain release factor 1 [Acidimicrobiia bacterium]|nr:peptide chain release factor 1 [Acidimicrobiia bacterium]